MSEENSETLPLGTDLFIIKRIVSNYNYLRTIILKLNKFTCKTVLSFNALAHTYV